MRRLVALLAIALAGPAASGAERPGWHLVPGSFAPGRGPDGNSVFLDAPDGLILVDTGRHPAHQDKLIAYARARGRPIAAIVNTHWHLDHSGGNAEIRAAYPRAQRLYEHCGGRGVDRLLPNSRKAAKEFLASGQASAELEAEIRRDFAAMDDVASLQATRPVTRSGEVRIAGRRLQLNLARFAATEGDVWIYDPRARLLIVGDLVVGPVPFFDTGCPEGWRQALTALAETPFVTLVPGHGAPMTEAAIPPVADGLRQFASTAPPATATRTPASPGGSAMPRAFIPAGDRRIDGMVGYYLDTGCGPRRRGTACATAGPCAEPESGRAAPQLKSGRLTSHRKSTACRRSRHRLRLGRPGRGDRHEPDDRRTLPGRQARTCHPDRRLCWRSRSSRSGSWSTIGSRNPTGAQASIAEGWGGPQTISGPLLVIPYRTTVSETVAENGQAGRSARARCGRS